MIEDYFHQCKKLHSILHQILSQGPCSQHHHQWDLQHKTHSRTLMSTEETQARHVFVVFLCLYVYVLRRWVPL